MSWSNLVVDGRLRGHDVATSAYSQPRNVILGFMPRIHVPYALLPDGSSGQARG
jgi:hypothetical protein